MYGAFFGMSSRLRSAAWVSLFVLVCLLSTAKSWALSPQTISFTAPATPVTYSPGLTIPLSATGGGSGNPVIFTLDPVSTGAGSIVGSNLNVTGVGVFVIDANQAGNGVYAAAPQVQREVDVNQPGNQLAISPGSLNAGNVATGESSAAMQVALINNGGSPVTFSSFTVSSDFSLSYPATHACSTASPLAIGAFCYVLVTANAPPALGAFPLGALTVTSNASNSTVSIPLSGNSVADVAMSPTSWGFGNVAVGMTYTQTVTLTNNQRVPLTFGTIGGLTGAYGSSATPACNGATLAPAASCAFVVTLVPPALGANNTTVTIPTNAPAPYNLLAINFSSNALAPAVTTPGSWGFGNVAVGGTYTKTVTVINNENVSLTLGTIGGLTGAYGSSATPACNGATLAPAASCAFVVTLIPSTSGANNTTVTIPTSAPSPYNSLSVNFSSNASAPVSTSPGSWGFGNVAVGATYTKTVTVTNNGNTTVSLGTIGGLTAGYASSSPTACDGASLAPAASCAFVVTLIPTGAGANNTTVTIPTSLPSPYNSLSVNFSSSASAPVSTSPGNWGFGNVAVGATYTKTVTVTNNGNTTVTLGTIGGLTAGYASSSPTACDGASLAPAASCAFVVTLVPSASGANNTTVSIPTSLPSPYNSLPVSFTSNASAPVSTSPGNWGFGNVAVGATYTKTVTVTNNGNTTVTLGTIGGLTAGYASSSPTACDGASLAPAASCAFVVTLIPTGAGANNTTVTIPTSLPSPYNSLPVSFTSNASAPVSTSPGNWGFGNVAVGQTYTKTVTVTNNGNTTVTLGTIGGLTGAYGSSATPVCNGASLAPAASCAFVVTLVPSASGANNTTVTIPTNLAPPYNSLSVSFTSNASAPVSTSPGNWGFGNVAVGGTYTQTVTVTNNGNTTVTLGTIGGLTGAYGSSATPACNGASLAPAASCSFVVTLVPSAFGANNTTVTIPTNLAPPYNSLSVGFSSNASAPISTNPGSWGFGNVAVGQTYTQTVTVTNNGNTTVTLGTIGGLTGAYGSSATPACNGASLAPAASCAFVVTLIPSTTGANNTTVTIPTSLPSPYNSLSVNFASNASAQVMIAPTTISFPSQLEGTPSAPVSVKVFNEENVPLTLSSVTVVGNNPGDFSYVNNCPAPIAAAAAVPNTNFCTIQVVFTPTASGTRSATLQITDGASNSPQTVALSGTGTASYNVSGSINLNTCGQQGNQPIFTVSINTTPTQTTTTDASGNFTFANIPVGQYTITPSIAGSSAVFLPATQSVALVNADVQTHFGASVGYSVSGSLSYTGSKSGLIYVGLAGTNCTLGVTPGTSISAPGSFTIRGVPPGSYKMQAFMDDLGYGSANETDPSSNSLAEVDVSVTNQNVTGVAAAIADPAPVTVSSAPTFKDVSAFNQAAFLQYNPVTGPDGNETATSYLVQWSTDPTFATVTGSKTFAATGTNGSHLWIIDGLTNDQTLYFRAHGSNPGSTGLFSSPSSAVTIGPYDGGNTVTGTVTFPGTATGPLYVGFYDTNTGNVYATEISNPISPQNYSVQVPNGSNYFNFAILDQSGTGQILPGIDISNTDSKNGNFVAITGPANNIDVTLPATSSTLSLTTQHWHRVDRNGSSDSYQLNFQVYAVDKLPVAAAMISGPNIVVPTDVYLCTSCGSERFSFNVNLSGMRPSPGDTYGVLVTYSDGTSETLSATVTTVLDALAIPISPSGAGAGTTPNFSWTDPANAGNYTYNFSLSDETGDSIWQIPGNYSSSNGFSNSITSITWGTDPTGQGSLPNKAALSSGTYYQWSITTQDSNGNEAQSEMEFQTSGVSSVLSLQGGGALSPGLTGIAYTGVIDASGGVGPYSWTVNGTSIGASGSILLGDNLTATASNSPVLTISGTPGASSTVNFNVAISDSTSQSAGPQSYSITVNSYTPPSLPAISLSSGITGIGYINNAISVAGGVGPYSWTVNGTSIGASGSILLGDNLTATASNSPVLTISGTPGANSTVNFNVSVTDSASQSAGPQSYSITVNPYVAPSLPVISLPSGTAGIAYFNNAISVQGGIGPYSWTVNGTSIGASGSTSLGDGLTATVNNSPVLTISGTPGSSSTVNFTLAVTDSTATLAGPQSYSINVSAYTPPSLPSFTLPTGTTGAIYGTNFCVTGGIGPYSWTINSVSIGTNGSASLGDNLTASVNNGPCIGVSGTPGTATTVPLNLSVTDSTSHSASQSYSIAVNQYVAPSLPSFTLPTGTTGAGYGANFCLTGGMSPYSWTINSTSIGTNGSASLGDNLSASVNGGGPCVSISGTPGTATTVPLNVSVTDAASQTATQTYSISVNQYVVPTLPSTTLGSAVVGQSYFNNTISVSGGLGPYSWTINGNSIGSSGSASLDDNLTATVNNGPVLTISGTPSSTTTVNLNVSVSDSTAHSAGPQSYPITVNVPSYSVAGSVNLTNTCGNLNGSMPQITFTINTNPTTSVTSNSNGGFFLNGIPNGTYTVTPSMPSAQAAIFSPASQQVTVNNGNVTGINFQAELAFSVSGSISYSGSQTGQVYVLLGGNNCGNSSLGTSISGNPLGTGAFTIHGVPPGTYTLTAYMDTLGFGYPDDAFPAGSTSGISVLGHNRTGLSVTMSDPGNPSSLPAPSINMIVPTDQGVVLGFQPVTSSSNGVQFEVPSSYFLQWSSTSVASSPWPTPSSFTTSTSTTFAFPAGESNGSNVIFLSNFTSGMIGALSNGTPYYFRLCAVYGSMNPSCLTYGGSRTTAIPVTIGAATPVSPHTVAGHITYSGSATGPMIVGFFNLSNGNFYGERISSPSSPQAYSLQVPTGSSYYFIAIVDNNNDGAVDPGDFSDFGSNGPPTVSISGDISNEDATLPSANSTATITTNHSKQTGTNTSESYSLQFTVVGAIKEPVSVELTSGPNIYVPVDFGKCTNCGKTEFNYSVSLGATRPTAGDTYQLFVTYSDGSTETLSPQVSAVLDAFVTAMTPATGGSTSTTPTFNWNYPANPGNYSYNFWISDNGPTSNGTIWQIPSQNSKSNGFTSSQIPASASGGTGGIVYGTDPTNPTNTPTQSSLSTTDTYMWQVQTIDSNGNVAQASTTYQP
jgi:hypothetical protein